MKVPHRSLQLATLTRGRRGDNGNTVSETIDNLINSFLCGLIFICISPGQKGFFFVVFSYFCFYSAMGCRDLPIIRVFFGVSF